MVNKRSRHGKNRRDHEPYRWLGAGAIGIGIGAAALAGSGAALADDGAADSHSPTSVASQPPDGNPSENQGGSHPRVSDDTAEAVAPAAESAEVESDEPNSTIPIASARHRASGPEPGPALTEPAAANEGLRGPVVADPAAEVVEPEPLAGLIIAQPQVAAAIEPPVADGGAHETRDVTVTTLSEPEAVRAAGASSLPGDGPTGSPESPLGLMFAAAERRDFAGAAVVSVAPSATVGRQSAPSWWTGRVFGRISATDADGDRLTYAGATTAKGSVTVTSSGSFTYTPTAAARHAAAAANAGSADTSDTFTITVSDGRGGVSTVPVTVAIRPVNSAPAWLRSRVARPDPLSGVVTGRVTATDRDGDTFTYAATTPTHGSVTIQTDGTFTYSPSPAARQRARNTWYTDTDRFRVTVNDGHGAVRTVAVRVTIAPSPPNSAPIPGTTTIGTPESTTGRINGSLNVTDPEGGSIAYRLSAAPTKGSLTVGGNGAFTYTPTPAARHLAATGAPGTRTDAASVEASDPLGATTSIALTFTILPRNSAPTNARATVGQPDSLTGAVAGTVRADDDDNDTLAYGGSTTTAKGAVEVAATGTFTFTPTAAARQNAAAGTATDETRTDSFTVTVDDGHGGTAALTVSVPILPLTVQPHPTPPTPPEPPAPPNPPTPGALAAFPGAEGFGASATGGRGGSVVYVTNTNASGVGSLQWAIDQPGAKYILFKVSGVIDTQIHLTNGDVTIAGQTSPGGITIRGFVTDETPYQDQAVRAPSDFAENWILQHIRIRPGLGGPSDDGLRLRYTRNAIVDHVSIGNATDEAVEISYSNNITIQNSILAETLGGHSFYGGVLMNYSNPAHGFQLDNIALHHNIFNRIEGRLPEGSRESLAAANSRMNLELSNTLYWDPRFFIALSPNTNVVTNSLGNPYPIYWDLNAVNNYFRVGNQFPYGMFDDQILRVAGNRLYVSGNQMSGYPTRSDYDLFYCCNDYPAVADPDDSSHRAQKLTSRHDFSTITYTPTNLLRSVLLNSAGAWPRDPMDVLCCNPFPRTRSPRPVPAPTPPMTLCARLIRGRLPLHRGTATVTGCPTPGSSPRA